jgi:hypothetical protein
MRRAQWVWGAGAVAVACSSSGSGDAPSDGGADDATLDAVGDVGAGGDAGAVDSTALGPLPDGSTGAPDDADDSAILDTGPALVPGCPVTVPEAGLACVTPGLWCEYGGGAHERCSTSAYCGPKRWNLFAPDPTCTLVNAAACPSTFGEPADASCPLKEGACDYGAGRCACVPCTDDEGGQGSLTQWFCRAWGDVQAYSDDSGAALALPGACPADRPQLGTACDAGFECGYDACYGVSLGPYEWCQDGAWGRGPQTDLCNPPECR